MQTSLPVLQQVSDIPRRCVMHRDFFLRATAVFDEQDADFRPAAGMLSVVEHIHHATAALELFVSQYFGRFGHTKRIEHHSFRQGRRWLSALPELGFADVSWLEQAATYQAAVERETLSQALTALSQTFEYVATLFARLDLVQLQQPLGENPVMPAYFTGFDVAEFMFDHTAHHRGALSQYARLLGHEPKIPYFDMAEVQHEASLRQ